MDNEKQHDPTGDLVVGVRFRPIGKIYHFDASEYPDLKMGDFVVVGTSRGQQLGQVACLTTCADKTVPDAPKPVGRKATGRDLAVRKYWENRESKAFQAARTYIGEKNLSIKVVRIEYSFDGKKLTCFYNAQGQKNPPSVKPLEQYLRKTFRARVELRQVGPRDAAKTLGGLGACGKVCCCSEFIVSFTPISIRMAKTQGVSLSPTEITGMCGRLRCCLGYEQQAYAKALKELPKRGKRAATPYGEGKVINLLPLQGTAVILIGNQQVKVHKDEIFTLEKWRELEARGELPEAKISSDVPQFLGQEARSVEQKEKPPTPKRPRRKQGKSGRSSSRPASESQTTTGTSAKTSQSSPPAEGDKKRSSRRRRGRRRPRKR